jgi:hypothetical protein
MTGRYVHSSHRQWTRQFQDTLTSIQALPVNLHYDEVILADGYPTPWGKAKLVELVGQRYEVFLG